MAGPAAGWYDDGRGCLRWWDGTSWTEHTAASGAATSPAALIPPVAPAVPAAPVAPADSTSPTAPVAPQRAHRRRLGPGAITLIILAALVYNAIPLGVVLGLTTGLATLSPTTAVVDYVQAWDAGDCAAFKDTVTAENFEQDWGSCGAFQDARESVADAYEGDSVVVVTDLEIDGSTAVVGTRETYTYDGDTYVDTYQYTLVFTNQGWRIDSVEYLDSVGENVS